MSYAATTLAKGGLDRIYDGIESILPGVQHSVVEMALWNAIEEFCRRSTYWRELVAWQMPPNVSKVNINPFSSSVHGIEILSVFGPSPAIPPPAGNVSSGRINYRLAPSCILIDASGDFTQTRYGAVWVTCKPTRLSDDLPDWFDDWSLAFRAGALFELFGHPAKPYSNATQALFYGKLFRSQIQLARAEARYNRLGDTPMYPYFARGRNVAGGGWAGIVGGGETPDTQIESGSNRIWMEDLSGSLLLEDGGYLILETQPPSGIGVVWGGGSVWQ